MRKNIYCFLWSNYKLFDNQREQGKYLATMSWLTLNYPCIAIIKTAGANSEENQIAIHKHYRCKQPIILRHLVEYGFSNSCIISSIFLTILGIFFLSLWAFYHIHVWVFSNSFLLCLIINDYSKKIFSIFFAICVQIKFWTSFFFNLFILRCLRIENNNREKNTLFVFVDQFR